MAISIEEVDRIAKLARLTFSDSEKQKLQLELSKILDYVSQVQKLADKAEPQTAYDKSGINLMRDDVAVKPEQPEEFIQQAPSRQGNYIKVKSILE